MHTRVFVYLDVSKCVATPCETELIRNARHVPTENANTSLIPLSVCILQKHYSPPQNEFSQLTEHNIRNIHTSNISTCTGEISICTGRYIMYLSTHACTYPPTRAVRVIHLVVCRESLLRHAWPWVSWRNEGSVINRVLVLADEFFFVLRFRVGRCKALLVGIRHDASGQLGRDFSNGTQWRVEATLFQMNFRHHPSQRLSFEKQHHNLLPIYMIT